MLCCSLFLLNSLTAKEDDSRLIRKIYLDLIGIVPTTEEIDWYMIYNTNGYEVAIDFVAKHPKNKWKSVSVEETVKILNSEEYKKSKRELSSEEMTSILFYVVGDGTRGGSYEDAKKTIVDSAIKCADSDVDKIDYISNILISRSTTIDESNLLLDVFKSTKGSDEDKLLKVLEKILEFEDFKNS